MYDVHVERSAGYAGIAFVVLVLLGAFLPGVPPPPDTPAPAVAAYLDAHRTLWQFAGWLVFPQLAFFLWFVVQLRAYLRLAPQIDDGLGTYLLVGGIAAAAFASMIGVSQLVLGFRVSADFGLPVIRALYDTFNAAGALILGPAAIMMVAASNSGRRHASLPRGLVVFGYVGAIGATIGTLSVFFQSGFLAMGGIGSVIVGLLPFALWVVWSSVVLIRAPRTGEKAA